MIERQKRAPTLFCLLGMLVSVVSSCSLPRTSPPTQVSPTTTPQAHWSAGALTADRSVTRIEVAGTHDEIGYQLGQWYRAQGFLPRDLTASEQETARALLAFYQDVAPSMKQHLQGVYAAYGLSLDDVGAGIPVWDEGGIRILLPGLVELHSCSVIFARPGMAVDGHARLARNHDWPTRLTDVLLVFTAPGAGYPTVVMTRGLPGFTASDGMNGAGLALGLASVRNVGYESPAGPALVSTAAYRLVLEQSANVEEAIALLRRLPVSFINPSPDEVISHILLADRSGASAVIEYLPEGIVVSKTDTRYQVMTNSHWAGPVDQPSCPRYRTAVLALRKVIGAVDDDRMMEIMASVRSSTQWTVVYDLEALSLELALPGDGFTQRHTLSLAGFIARMNARE